MTDKPINLDAYKLAKSKGKDPASIVTGCDFSPLTPEMLEAARKLRGDEQNPKAGFPCDSDPEVA